MIYSFGARVDNDSNAITVIDEENETAVTTGYVNGEYVEFSGGGGSSDFSTAEVTIVHVGAFGTVFGSMPHCYEAGEVAPEAPATIESTFEVEQGETSVFTVPIYQNGVLDANFNDAVQIISVTGEAEWETTDSDVYITGDCTITASVPE